MSVRNMRVHVVLIDRDQETIQQILPASHLEQQNLVQIPTQEAKQEAITRATDVSALMDLMHREIRVKTEMMEGDVAPNVVMLGLQALWALAQETRIMAKEV